MHDARHIDWEGFANTRDLGGLPTRDRGTTRFGAFIRSAQLRSVTPAGWRSALAAGVRTVIDLRNDDETALAAGTAAPPGVNRIGVPLDDIDDTEFWRFIDEEGLDGSPLYYRPFLEHKSRRCAAVLTALAQAEPGGVLFHCELGRDRTGLITLLLLSLLDVEPDVIAEDYELSTHPLEPVLRGTTVRAAMLAVLDEFDAETYLRDAGVSAADVDAIRDRLGGSET